MNLVLPRTTFLQTLKLKRFRSSNAPVGFPFRALNFSSASCQQSLEVGDNSAGEVHEEVQVQQSAAAEEKTKEKREELVKRAQLPERVLEHISSEPDQDVHSRRFPLRVVVESCVHRWFKEYIKAAEKGDLDAHMTVGQMICHGYGVQKDVHKGEEWIKRAQCKRRYKQSKESQDKKRQEDEEFFFI